MRKFSRILVWEPYLLQLGKAYSHVSTEGTRYASLSSAINKGIRKYRSLDRSLGSGRTDGPYSNESNRGRIPGNQRTSGDRNAQLEDHSWTGKDAIVARKICSRTQKDVAVSHRRKAHGGLRRDAHNVSPSEQNSRRDSLPRARMEGYEEGISRGKGASRRERASGQGKSKSSFDLRRVSDTFPDQKKPLGLRLNSQGFEQPPRGKYVELSRFRKSRKRRQRVARDLDDDVVRIKKFIVPPKPIPYTTAASEFIYGTSAVMAALRCSRRKLYTLYIYGSSDNMFEPETKLDESFVRTARKLGYVAGVNVKHVAGKWIQLLDKMSGGRPHNGFVLEASPLPKLPVDYYEPVPSPSATNFGVKLASQSEEEEAVNGIDNLVPRMNHDSSSWDTALNTYRRYPFTLLLDGILDPGNLGAIIRSAYYLGADAIAFSARNSAPFSPVTIKASAGAAENIPLISVTNPASFIDMSRKNGWRFFAAEAPKSTVAGVNALEDPLPQESPAVFSPSDLGSKLTESPCVLMLGGEGLGLSKKLRRRADAVVAIPGTFTNSSQDDLAGVDSLNVSVASALLCEAFLRQPVPAGRVAPPPQPMIGASDGIGSKDIIGEENQVGANDNRVF